MPRRAKYFSSRSVRRGVLVVQGDHATMIPTTAVSEVDPTGAGDSFCGATLARLGQKQHPIMAARQALPLVAAMVGPGRASGIVSR